MAKRLVLLLLSSSILTHQYDTGMSASETFTNPLESGRINSTIGQRGKGVDATISSATCINAATFQELLTRLTLVESNEERLTIVEQEKTKFLFTSAQLIALIEITPSVKTRLSIITMIGPRLTDPRAKVTELMGMFRYSEEKERVQEVLKGRTQVLASSLFKPSGLSAAIVGTTTTSTTSTDGSPPTSAVKSAAPAFEFKGLAAARPRTTTQTITTKPRSPSNATPVGVEGLTMMNSSETMTSTTTTTTATATSSMAKNSRNNQHLSNAAPSSSQKVQQHLPTHPLNTSSQDTLNDTLFIPFMTLYYPVNTSYQLTLSTHSLPLGPCGS